MKRIFWILTFSVTIALAALTLAISRNPYVSFVIEQRFPAVLPAYWWARNLESSDPDLVRESLHLLTLRQNPVGVGRAVRLLQHTNGYVWLDAAHYLGACGCKEATPYLIKALRHSSLKADADTVRYLRALTARDFGADFPQWQRWWLAQYPNSHFDWISHLGTTPRLHAHSSQ